MSAPKERPILFSGPMVTAILSGQKTQTRRVITPQPDEDGLSFLLTAGAWQDTSERIYRCPFGRPGDRLWVREAFSSDWMLHQLPPREWPDGAPVHYWADGNPEHGDWTPPKPPIFMPRWASRLTLEVVSVRVERLQDITVADVVAEGIDLDGEHADDFLNAEHAQAGGLSIPCDHPEVYPFVRLWDSINAERGHAWADNPWVWVVEFKAVTP